MCGAVCVCVWGVLGEEGKECRLKMLHLRMLNGIKRKRSKKILYVQQVNSTNYVG